MKYLSLLKHTKSISIEPVGSVEWAWLNGQPVSPAIVKAWREAGLIEDDRVGFAIPSEKAKRLLERVK